MVVLGYVLKQVIAYFISSAKQKDQYIISLVGDNEKNVEKFVNTVNHNQTKMNEAVDRLTHSIDVQTDIFTKIINDSVIPSVNRRVKQRRK